MHSPSSECTSQVKVFHEKTAKTSLLLFTFPNATFTIFGKSRFCRLEYSSGIICISTHNMYFNTLCMTFKPASADLAQLPLKLQRTLEFSSISD